MTVTCTRWPTFTTSAGFLTKLSESWLTWTRPSWCTPMSTKAPKAVTLVTMPGSFMPGLRSSIFSTPSAKVNASNCLRGSRPGLASSARMSFSVGRPTSAVT